MSSIRTLHESMIEEFLSSERSVLKIRGGRGSLKTSMGVHAAYEYVTTQHKNAMIVCSDMAGVIYTRNMFCSLYGKKGVTTSWFRGSYGLVTPAASEDASVVIVSLEQLDRFVKYDQGDMRIGLAVFDECFYTLAKSYEITRRAFDHVVDQSIRKIFIYSLAEIVNNGASTQIGEVDLTRDIDIEMSYESVPVSYLGEEFFRCADILKKVNREQYEEVYLDLPRKKMEGMM